MPTQLGTAATAVEDAVVYDPFTEEFQRDPFVVYARLRREAPVYYSEKWDFYALSTFADVRAALHDSETYLNFQGVDIDDFEQEQSAFPGMLPNIDNPRHDQLRTVVQRSFMPRSIRALTDEVREVCDDLLDSFAQQRKIDISADYAWAIPFDVFYNFLGMPEGEIREKFVEWTHGIKHREAGSPELTDWARESSQQLREYLAQLLRERRENPRDDVLTAIVQAEIDGEQIAPEEIDFAAEITGLAFALYLGGVETTAGNISTLLEQLARHPDQLQALIDDPTLVPRAVEETLRYRTIFQVTARTTSREVRVRDTVIPAGKRVFLILGSANRDETVWEDAESFDIHREAKPHLGFGEGLHGCLGNPLARLETTIALEQLIRRGGPFRLAGEPRRYVTTPNAYVLDQVPVQFERPFAPREEAAPADGAASDFVPSGALSAPEAGKCPVPHDDPEAMAAFMAAAGARSDTPVPPAPVAAPAPSAPAAVTPAAPSTISEEIPALVMECTEIADGVVALRLEPLIGGELPAWEPGAHIDLVMGEGEQLVRQYSLCGDPADRSSYRVAVLREAEGTGGSRHVHEQLRVASRVRIRGPRNHFELVDAERYHFIAGGIGITPIRSMICAAEEAGKDWVLDYCGRSASGMALRDELIGYGDRVRFWASDRSGRIDLPAVLGIPEPGTLVYTCGPERLTDEIEALCEEHWPEGSLHIERFTPLDFSDAENLAFGIRLGADGPVLPVGPDQTALEVLEAAGVPVVSSCREGTCGTCEVPVLDGEVEHRDAILTPAEKKRNDCMMVCVSRACSRTLALDV